MQNYWAPVGRVGGRCGEDAARFQPAPLFQRGSDELFSACVTNGPFIMSSNSASTGNPNHGPTWEHFLCVSEERTWGWLVLALVTLSLTSPGARCGDLPVPAASQSWEEADTRRGVPCSRGAGKCLVPCTPSFCSKWKRQQEVQRGQQEHRRALQGDPHPKAAQ